MKNTVRATFRLLSFFVLSFVTVLCTAAGNVSIGFFSQTMAIRWKNLLISWWARSTALILGATVDVRGKPPEPPFFLVSNHLSYIDVVPLWMYLDATFIAKSEVKSWPFFGWGTKTLGVLFINRELKRDVQRLNNKISDVISDEQGVILFPEGTSSKGADVLPFNAPLLQYPANNQMPVYYATITYNCNWEGCNPEQNICWWGDMPFFGHFWNLLKVPGFKIEITFSDKTVQASDRKLLAKKLHESVKEQFHPVAQSSAQDLATS